ncbi:MAG: hypothetical protein M1816_004505 [Peltula sp. TS41687]|nr:MAG: hypothetical protein M1816_004505 [Peltula sp. TS41687]
MTSIYEVEHNVPTTTSTQTQRSRRPDLSTFFSALSTIDTTHTSNPHALPTPVDVSAPYRLLADAFQVMRRDGAGESDSDNDYASLMDTLTEALLREAETPPREVQGCDQEFLDGLDRVPKTSLKKADVCPICNNPFLDDKYPLVVRLPCHRNHVFDLECIAPWLKLHSTCPLDRIDLLKRKEGKQAGAATTQSADRKVDDEEEWDDMYA